MSRPGTLSFQDAVRLVRNRGRYMQEAVPVGEGAMAAILGLDEAGVIKACEEAAQGEVVSAANLNAPGQIVIAGSAAAVARAGERAKALGAKRAIPLQVSAPFHCALMKPAEDRLAPELRAAHAHDPRDSSGRQRRCGAEANRRSLDRRADQAGLGAGAMGRRLQRLASEGVTRFVEVGPGKVLTGLAKKIAPGATLLNVEGPDDLPALEALFSAA